MYCVINFTCVFFSFCCLRLFVLFASPPLHVLSTVNSTFTVSVIKDLLPQVHARFRHWHPSLLLLPLLEHINK